jgi:predicted nucleic acid-binding protein
VSGYVVVDASLAVKWVLNEVHSDNALALARRWATEEVQPLAPYLLPVEADNVIHRRMMKGEFGLETALRLMEALLRAGIVLREQPGLHCRAIELAGQLAQGAVYDAHYLALAEMVDCELWTADERFHRAASGTFGRVKWVGEES